MKEITKSRLIAFFVMMIIYAIIGLILNYYIDYPKFFLYWEIMAVLYSGFGSLLYIEK